MIVCALDDLIFSVKISTAAKALGVDVYFERSAKVVDTVRARQPSLVILDLNATRLAPMSAIAAIKADASLAGTRTLGFVSHVDTATIEAARAAGIDQVLARSAFADRLGEILTSA
jgi:DNA-binding NarL/FixJ family response regulator